MKQKKINTRYDHFGGHSSGTIQKQNRPQTYLQRLSKQSLEDKKLYDKIVEELSNLFVDRDIKLQWQKDIKSCLNLKKAFEEKKSKGKKVKPVDDPLPIESIIETQDFSIIKPDKHLPAMKVILAIFHKKMLGGFNRIISKETIALYPKIDKVAFSARILNLFWESVKKMEAYNRDAENKDSKSSGRADEQNKPSDLITVSVTVHKFSVSKPTLYRAKKDERLTNWGTDTMLLFSEKEVAKIFTER